MQTELSQLINPSKFFFGGDLFLHYGYFGGGGARKLLAAISLLQSYS